MVNSLVARAALRIQKVHDLVQGFQVRRIPQECPLASHPHEIFVLEFIEMMGQRGCRDLRRLLDVGNRRSAGLEGFDYREFFMARFSVGDCLWSDSGGLGDTRESSRYAHRAGPDPEAERQYSARECVV